MPSNLPHHGREPSSAGQTGLRAALSEPPGPGLCPEVLKRAGRRLREERRRKPSCE